MALGPEGRAGDHGDPRAAQEVLRQGAAILEAAPEVAPGVGQEVVGGRAGGRAFIDAMQSPTMIWSRGSDDFGTAFDGAEARVFAFF